MSVISPTVEILGSTFATFPVYRRLLQSPGAVPHATPAPATAPVPAGMRCRPGCIGPDHFADVSKLMQISKK